jgi:hypothetical protein
VLRQPSGADAPSRLLRRASEAARALGAAGVTLTLLDGPAAAACLARALDPAGELRPAALDGNGLSGTEQPVTLARRPTGLTPTKASNR